MADQPPGEGRVELIDIEAEVRARFLSGEQRYPPYLFKVETDHIIGIDIG